MMETRQSYEYWGNEAGSCDYEPTFTGLLFKDGHCVAVLFNQDHPLRIEEACWKNDYDRAVSITEQTGTVFREFIRRVDEVV